MVAVDTNVLVRLLTEDEPKQAAAARALFATESIWIPKTVLLETWWVLHSMYGFDGNAIYHAFTKLLGLKNVRLEDQDSVATALELTLHGVEFADATHLNSRPAGCEFVSFDKAFVRRATRAGVTKISSPG